MPKGRAGESRKSASRPYSLRISARLKNSTFAPRMSPTAVPSNDPMHRVGCKGNFMSEESIIDMSRSLDWRTLRFDPHRSFDLSPSPFWFSAFHARWKPAPTGNQVLSASPVNVHSQAQTIQKRHRSPAKAYLHFGVDVATFCIPIRDDAAIDGVVSSLRHRCAQRLA